MRGAEMKEWGAKRLARADRGMDLQRARLRHPERRFEAGRKIKYGLVKKNGPM